MALATLVEGKDYFIDKNGKAHFKDMTYGPVPPVDNQSGAKGNTQVTFSSSTNSSVVSDHAIDVLGKIAANAGETSIMITSTIRTPQSQARAMYTNVENTSWDKQRARYGYTGQAVLNAGEKAQKAAKEENPDISREKLQVIVLEAMEEEILSQSEKGNRTSNHLVSAEQYAKLNVIDIGYSSLSDKSAFIDAVDKAESSGLISRYLDEPENGCVHIEISVK
jgi:hypothetical protein